MIEGLKNLTKMGEKSTDGHNKKPTFFQTLLRPLVGWLKLEFGLRNLIITLSGVMFTNQMSC